MVCPSSPCRHATQHAYGLSTDITYASLAKAFNQPLRHHAETLRRMNIMSQHRKDIANQTDEQRAARERMALFPERAEVIYTSSEIWVVRSHSSFFDTFLTYMLCSRWSDSRGSSASSQAFLGSSNACSMGLHPIYRFRRQMSGHADSKSSLRTYSPCYQRLHSRTGLATANPNRRSRRT